ncbi:MAG: DUF692 domain-containing protein [Beijerinckiaceae bacterium]
MISTRVLPSRVGIGLKAEHVDDLIQTKPNIAFLEIHAENYMGAGGPPHAYLSALREVFALSIHGVGLSIGGAGPLDELHMARLAALVDRYQPDAFSEHLAWSTHGGVFFNDLLPIVYDNATLKRVIEHVDRVQTRLRRKLLLENPSTYVGVAQNAWAEVDFIAEVARRSGCGLLLDVSNVYVSCINHGRDPEAYIDAFPIDRVEEIHLAGFAEDSDAAGARLLIDAHGTPVDDDVWALYCRTLRRAGPVATLIEWDNDVPALPVLVAQALLADAALAECAGAAGAAQ